MPDKLFNKPFISLGSFIYSNSAKASNRLLPLVVKIKRFFILGKASDATAHFVPAHSGSPMVGRWTGVLAAFDLSETQKKILLTPVPLLGGAIIPLLKELSAAENIFYLSCIPALMAGFVYQAIHESKVTNILKFQHIDYDESTGSGH